jgi:LemA protein
MKNWIIPISIIALLLIIVWRFNNKAVSLKENANNKWGDVESAYQRRYDLIDNLVATVKGAADFEKSTLESVIQARANATKITIDPTNMTPEKLAEFQQAQTGMMGAFSKLMAVAESYPQLTATQNFKELQSQIEGTENRINVARDRYNEEVNPYNKLIKKFPGALFAGMLGFDELNYFKSEAGAEKAPKVDFNK